MADETRVPFVIHTRTEGAGLQSAKRQVEDLTKAVRTARVETGKAGAASATASAGIERMGASAQQATTRSHQATGAMRGLGRGGRDMGLAALEASRALEDLQYGIRGVVNNIPLLAMSLGGSAGIAAAASVAAVAISQIVTRLSKLKDDGGAALEKLTEDANRMASAFSEAASEELADSLDEVRRNAEASKEEIDRATKVQGQAIDNEKELLEKRKELLGVTTELATRTEDAMDLTRIRQAVAEELKLIEARIREIELRKQSGIGEAGAGMMSAARDLQAARESVRISRQRWERENEMLLVQQQRLKQLEQEIELEKTARSARIGEAGMKGGPLGWAAAEIANLGSGRLEELQQQAEFTRKAAEATNKRVNMLGEAFTEAEKTLRVADAAAEASGILYENALTGMERQREHQEKITEANEAIQDTNAGLAEGSALADTLKQTAAGLRAKWDDLSSAQKAQVAVMEEIAQDGVVTAGEINRASTAIQTVMTELGQAQGNFGTLIVDGLKDLRRIYETQTRALQREIQALKAQSGNQPVNRF